MLMCRYIKRTLFCRCMTGLPEEHKFFYINSMVVESYIIKNTFKVWQKFNIGCLKGLYGKFSFVLLRFFFIPLGWLWWRKYFYPGLRKRWSGCSGTEGYMNRIHSGQSLPSLHLPPNSWTARTNANIHLEIPSEEGL